MALYISEDVAKHLNDKYGIDITKDKTISTKPYNPHCCIGRVWKSDPEYIHNAGGYSNFQCCNAKYNEYDFCEVHQRKFIKNELTLGIISDPPPVEAYIIDMDNNKIKYFWIHQSDGMKVEEIFIKEELVKQEKYNEKRGRGRPPSKKILYKNIEWGKLNEEGNLDSLPLPSLKEYLTFHKLNIYGKKSDLINRIEENIKRSIMN